MAARKRKPAPVEVVEADEIKNRQALAALSVDLIERMILRCHRERDQVEDIETTPAELREGVEIPLYTLRVQIV